MIRCEKCGKIYDYEKTYGICPKCARYNRKDSNVTTERELHRKYDGNPWAHMADESHREVHRANGDTYRHQTTAQKAERRKKGSANPVSKIFWVIVTILVILCAGGSIIMEIVENIGFNRIPSAIEHLTDRIGDTGWDADDYMSDAADGVSVASVWSTYIGRDLSDSSWQDLVNVTDEQLAELEKLVLPDDEVYYLVSFYVENNTDVPCDLEQTVVEFQAEGDRKIPCQGMFVSTINPIDARDTGYLDCLIAIPETTEELHGTCTFGDETREFDVDFYHE